jgi:hypothetical protein
MAYYKGDYYRGRGRGDYYRGHGRGDPFWGALWTGIKAVGGALLGVRPAAPATPPFAGGAPPSQTSLARIASGLTGALVPMGQAAMQAEASRATFPPYATLPSTRIAGAPALPPSVRLMASHDGQVVAVRRRRRMNPANPQALRRSIRRVVGFGRLAMRSKKAIAKAATAIGVKRSQSAPRRKR